jgi:hypothetical protein
MSEAKPQKLRLSYGLTKELIAVIVSVVSFAVSVVGFYTGSLKAPDLRFYTAPYIRHVVDSASRNEAFFVPLTLANRGARPGTILSLELTVVYLPDGSERRFFGQYFAQDNTQDMVGGFFTPLTLNGYSAEARTVCFYPQGSQPGNFFARAGEYEFRLRGLSANVRGAADRPVTETFHVRVDDGMVAVMQSQPDGEYVYPIATERVP